ncbi:MULTISPECIES: TetR/AcrR family transcriptional regulator [unclassified Epibacterium]|uniref:TetR/AcrR family transcriptional regulator n=1 Tax=unclassified Epibacterium TaxID=2639179 RepID=UPI001EF74EE3|nr:MULTISPECIES: TetR/AcrR family transcriptional regulator [unclassified Epibacterium]MCG7622087.1 TetR/AcrR family transcriptional regulator [Epibacterium sp. Ofav1-8]MCG7626922.1 TetR/AcrR family transcriptional regulator [Epibacterium sp. MM17-32]
MTSRPLLHRDDPDAAPLIGNIKVTRDDWLNVALDVLIRDGVERVKVLALAEAMGVSRSSFYWYFKSRQDLLDALLTRWEETNTAGLIAQAQAPAERVTGAVLNIFRCIANPDLFDTALDFAVRDWARRSDAVLARMRAGDAARVAALTSMFQRYGCDDLEALTRAKVLYYMQLGYDMAEPQESHDYRLSMTPEYLKVFTGQAPTDAEMQEFADYSRRFWRDLSR